MDNKVKEISDRIDNITQILKKTSISRKSEKEKLFLKILITLENVLEYIEKKMPIVKVNINNKIMKLNVLLERKIIF